MMKFIRLKMAILAIVSSAIPALAGGMLPAGEMLPASIQNCTWCHGTSAQGFANAPRLAGQRPQYIWNQLVSFVEHRRDNPLSRQYMWSAAAALGPQEARDLAIYFSTLPPEPANDGRKGLIAMGRVLYEEGSPETNLASCAACHGPNAEGVREIPRLGGMSYAYLKRRLEEWRDGYDATAVPPMPGIARKLYPDEIEAIASYLSFVQSAPFVFYECAANAPIGKAPYRIGCGNAGVAFADRPVK
jgi:cytochrome c553